MQAFPTVITQAPDGPVGRCQKKGKKGQKGGDSEQKGVLERIQIKEQEIDPPFEEKRHDGCDVEKDQRKAGDAERPPQENEIPFGFEYGQRPDAKRDADQKGAGQGETAQKRPVEFAGNQNVKLVSELDEPKSKNNQHAF